MRRGICAGGDGKRQIGGLANVSCVGWLGDLPTGRERVVALGADSDSLCSCSRVAAALWRADDHGIGGVLRQCSRAVVRQRFRARQPAARHREGLWQSACAGARGARQPVAERLASWHVGSVGGNAGAAAADVLDAGAAGVDRDARVSGSGAGVSVGWIELVFSVERRPFSWSSYGSCACLPTRP